MRLPTDDMANSPFDRWFFRFLAGFSLIFLLFLITCTIGIARWIYKTW